MPKLRLRAESPPPIGGSAQRNPDLYRETRWVKMKNLIFAMKGQVNLL